MDAQQLLNAVAELRPNYEAAEHLRIALLLSLHYPNLDFSDTEELERLCLEITIRLGATSDQHAAVAGELDSLAATSPCEYSPDHLWSLVRALKVQTQILDLYLR